MKHISYCDECWELIPRDGLHDWHIYCKECLICGKMVEVRIDSSMLKLPLYRKWV